MTQEEMVVLKAEIQDLVNQVLIKMKNVPKVKVTTDYYGESTYYGTPVKTTEEEREVTGERYKYDDDYNIIMEESDEHLYLASVKETLETITNSENGATHLMEKYYTSTC